MGCTQIEAKKPIHQKQKNHESQISISENIENKKEPEKEKLKSKKLESEPSNKKVEISNKGGNISIALEEKENSKINIIIPLENGEKWEKEYNENEKVEKVIEDFKNENNSIIPPKFNIDWKCNNNPLKLNDKIKDILPKKIPSVILDFSLETKGLNLSHKNNCPEIIAKPLSEPFEICCFEKKKKIIKIINFNPNEIAKNEIDSFSHSSAFCNGNDHLYISGGENNRKVTLGYIWDIDLKNKTINKLQKEIEPKKNHSMIFIPDNYVFIIGGNDKKTYYFDINTKEIFPYADLNFERYEPALILIDDDLYCFDNIKKQNSNLTFEKSNLKIKAKWELITPKIDSSINGDKFKQKFFGVSKLDNENIIFLGGDMDKNKISSDIPLMNYQYNIKDNIIKQSETNFKQINLTEKTFLNFDTNHDFIFPDFNKACPEVVFFNKKKNKIDIIHFGQEEKSERKYNTKTHNSTKLKSNLPILNFGIKKNEKLNFNMPQFDSNFNSKNDDDEFEIDTTTKENKFNFNSNIDNYQYSKNQNSKINGNNYYSAKEITKVNLENSNLNSNKNMNFDNKTKDNKNKNDLKNSKFAINQPKFPNIEVKNPNQNLDDKISDIKIDNKKPEIDIKKSDINGNNNIEGKIDINDPKINIKEPKIDVPNINETNNKPEINIDINKPKNNIETEIKNSKINVESHNININNQEIKINTEIKPQESPKFGKENNINIDINNPEINNNLEINSPKFNLNSNNTETNIPNLEINIKTNEENQQNENNLNPNIKQSKISSTSKSNSENENQGMIKLDNRNFEERFANHFKGETIKVKPKEIENQNDKKSNKNENEYNGNLLRSSIIKGNKSVNDLNNNLPHIESKKTPLKSSKIGVTGELENEEDILKNIHGSVNVGINGRKGSNKIEND